MAATLHEFTVANDAAAATTKKLQKQAVLAEYLRGLAEPDLRLAVRFAGGRAFAATDERVLSVGGAIVSDVLLSLLQLDPRAFHDLVVRSGEVGEALSKVWPTADEPLRLKLADLAETFDALAATGNGERKRELLAGLFSRCVTGREAAYVAKIIFRDMRTGVQEGVLQAAVAAAFAKPLAEIQRTQLLVGDLDEVAVLAQRGDLCAATFRLFHPIQFMLATPQETAADAAQTLGGRPFFCEDKLDGIRAQVHKQAGRIHVYTRTMDRTDESFPDVVDALAELPGEFLLDGEIVPYKNGVVQPFANIQKRLGRKVLTAKILRDHPCAFIAFDILYKDGELLMDRPLRERRRELEKLTPSPLEGEGGGEGEGLGRGAALTRGGTALPSSAKETQSTSTITPHPNPLPQGERGPEGMPLLLLTRVSEVTSAEEITAAFEGARARRNEGIVLKDPESPYSPGRRGKMWLKLKTHLPTFDCVVTAAEYGHGKRRDSLSDYTFAVWDREPTEEGATLVNVGKAYIGVTDAEIAQLTETFLKLSRGNNGRVHVVEPKVVLEIAADQIQRSARHASGYALRFPRVKRIRWDKRPEEADRLARIAEIYESSHNFGKSTPPEPRPAEPTLFDGM